MPKKILLPRGCSEAAPAWRRGDGEGEGSGERREHGSCRGTHPREESRRGPPALTVRGCSGVALHAVIDPLERWRAVRREARLRRAADLRGHALHARTRRSSRAPTWRSSAPPPTTSSPTGRAPVSGRGRSAPPAVLRARTWRPEVDGFAALRVVDFGDAPVLPGRPAAAHAAIERTVGQVLAAGAIPIVLGGDHGIAEPDIRACAGPAAARSGSSTSTPTPTPGTRSSGSRPRTGRRCGAWSSRAMSTPAATSRSGCAATGPARRSSPGRRERGITSFFMHDVRELGIGDGRRARRRGRGGGARVFLSVDIDVLDPAFAPGHGHAGAGRDDQRRAAAGLPPAGSRRRARRRRARRGDPDRASARPTSRRSPRTRVVREIVTGIALRRAWSAGASPGRVSNGGSGGSVRRHPSKEERWTHF